MFIIVSKSYCQVDSSQSFLYSIDIKKTSVVYLEICKDKITIFNADSLNSINVTFKTPKKLTRILFNELISKTNDRILLNKENQKNLFILRNINIKHLSPNILYFYSDALEIEDENQKSITHCIVKFLSTESSDFLYMENTVTKFWFYFHQKDKNIQLTSNNPYYIKKLEKNRRYYYKRFNLRKVPNSKKEMLLFWSADLDTI